MPLLDVESVLCIDLPGHGRSSHIPRGISVNFTDYIIFLRHLISNALSLKKVSFIGHSYGSCLSYSYAGLFPEHVELMVNLDCSRLATSAKNERALTDVRTSVSSFLNAEDLDEVDKGYSWDETVRHLYKVRQGLGMPLSMESCKLIAERSTTKLGNMFYKFSFDSRVKDRSLGRFTNSFNLALARRITCPVLNIQAKKGLAFMETSSIDREELDKHLQHLERSSSKFLNATLDGFHHVHMDNPEPTASLINTFVCHL